MRGDIQHFLPFRGKQKETNGIGEDTCEGCRRKRGRLSRSRAQGFIARAQERPGPMSEVRAYFSALAGSGHGFAVNFPQPVLNILPHLLFSTVDLSLCQGSWKDNRGIKSMTAKFSASQVKKTWSSHRLSGAELPKNASPGMNEIEPGGAILDKVLYRETIALTARRTRSCRWSGWCPGFPSG